MTTKHIWLTLGALVSTGLLAACGGGGSEGAAPDGQANAVTPAEVPQVAPERTELVISQPSDALTLDPYKENESPTFNILSNIFDPLVTLDENIEIAPDLATSWENIDDVTWHFHLREGVTFHNGSGFTAEDVVYSLDRAQNWELSSVKADLSTVDTVRAIDPLTVELITKAPDPILLRRLAQILIMDMETTERMVQEQGDDWTFDNPIGTGAYRLHNWVREQHVQLEAFEDHWRGKPEIDWVVFKPLANPANRVFNLLNGDSHLITDVPVTQTRQIEAAPGVVLSQVPSMRLIYLALDNMRDESPGVPDSPPNPLRDRRVREAIYLAINEDLIVERVMDGFAVAASQLVSPNVLGYDPTIERPAYNPDRARELLAEAGYPEGFRLVLDSPNNRYHNDAQIAQAIAGQLARVGIEVEVDARQKNIFFADEEAGECSFYLIGWANNNGDGASSFEYLLHTYDPERQLGTSNMSSTTYSNAELDALVDAAQSEMDPDARLDLLQRAMRIAMEDLPHIPLHYQVHLCAAAEDLDWEPRSDGRLRAYEMGWR